MKSLVRFDLVQRQSESENGRIFPVPFRVSMIYAARESSARKALYQAKAHCSKTLSVCFIHTEARMV